MQQQRDNRSRLIEHRNVTRLLYRDPAGMRRQLGAPAGQHRRQHPVAGTEGDGDRHADRAAVPETGAFGGVQRLPEAGAVAMSWIARLAMA